jgi:hypothetical protein
MSDRLDLYTPINTLKPVAENIWIVDGPEISFYKMPFPTRMTVIRLKTGDLFIHSPTPLTVTLKTEIDALGTVRHLISSNFIHYWWIGEWGEHYPDAIKWASPKVRPRAAKHGITFDQNLGDTPEMDWAEEIDQIIVRGGRAIEEVEFFHKPSQTLILTDFIQNFESARVHSIPLKALMRFGGVADPDGKMPYDLHLSFIGRWKQLKSAVQTMINWNPERVILAHGRWYEKDGTSELRRAFRRLGPFE